MFSSFMAKVTATLISIILTFGTTFGIYKAPTTKASSEYFDKGIKNVIYLIGDGMGFNHLEKTKAERNTALVMDTFDIQGSAMTRSLTKKVTDSAASGTALATGSRTYNKAIGVYLFDSTPKYSYPKNLRELCSERGMLTGVVTTDETTGATPSAFSAHSSDRYNTEDITMDQLSGSADLIWGQANGVATKSEAQANGYTYVTTYSEMMALEEGSRSYGQFTNALWTLEQSDKNTPNLEQMAMKAIDLLDDSDEGFFLMIEGAHIDKHSHSNRDNDMTEALLEFDSTVEAVLEYAKNDGETLVVITADHETGAIKADGEGYKFTSGDHSAADVPLLVYGSDKIISKGEKINNYEIPMRIAYTIGFSEEDFPVAVIM